jgi:hypothetical protein
MISSKELPSVERLMQSVDKKKKKVERLLSAFEYKIDRIDNPPKGSRGHPPKKNQYGSHACQHICIEGPW